MKKLMFLLLFLPFQHVYSQSCNPQIPNSTTSNRFIVLGDGSEVKDKATGLIWLRCSVGQTWNGSTCIGEPVYRSWQGALKSAKDVGNSYRLPNIKEFQSIVESSCSEPAINIEIFPNTNSWVYWSSTPNKESSLGYAIDFRNGLTRAFFMGSAGGMANVRAVKSE